MSTPSLRNRNIGSSIKLEFNGDWAKLMDLLNSQDLLLAAAAMKGQEEAAKQFKGEIVGNIKTHGSKFGYPAKYPVSPGYALYKMNKGKNPNDLFVFSGTYADSVVIVKKGLKVSVGIPKSTPHPDSKLTVSQIANVLEHGSFVRDVKARPLWRDTFKHFGGKKMVGGIIMANIALMYKKKNIPITNKTK